jgi:tetratricopeptide (TPR) repeat protein
MPRGPSFANVAVIGLDCADQAPKDAPWKVAAQKTLEPLVEEAVGLPDVLADDRSSIYGTLAGRAEDKGDEAGAKAWAGRWLTFLEEQAAAAPSPEARAAFDSHRVSAAMMLGTPERALPAVQQSEKDLPGDYNPPARQALLYREMKKYDEAIDASRRALDKAYGPRKLRIYDVPGRRADEEGGRRRRPRHPGAGAAVRGLPSRISPPQADGGGDAEEAHGFLTAPAADTQPRAAREARTMVVPAREVAEGTVPKSR